ncbi:MAG: fbpA 2 [Herbaspirillum sp.]|jgi:iron(III) transport system substrate-binding protein|nr:fbpA 2 [Herbaspirillum sp.]
MTAHHRSIACVLAFAFFLAGAAHAQPIPTAPAATGPALYNGSDREQRLMQGAKQEGALTVYTSLTVQDTINLGNAFDKKYGIKPKFWRAGSEGVLQRIITESRAGHFEFDVVETNGPELEALHREQTLQKAWSPYLADLLPEAIQPHREWVGTRLNMFVQIYNTKLLKKEDFPKSYQDLLDPKWKGQIGIEAADIDWFGTVVKEIGEEKGIKFFRDLAATNGISVRKGHTLLAGLTASGEVPLALTVYSHNADQLKAKGAPVDWSVIQPAIIRPNGMGISKKPPHPNAAALFYDFMLSDGQAILAGNEYLTASRKTTSGILNHLNLKFIDPATVLDENDKWEKLFTEIITQQQKR